MHLQRPCSYQALLRTFKHIVCYIDRPLSLPQSGCSFSTNSCAAPVCRVSLSQSGRFFITNSCTAPVCWVSCMSHWKCRNCDLEGACVTVKIGRDSNNANLACCSKVNGQLALLFFVSTKIIWNICIVIIFIRVKKTWCRAGSIIPV